MQSTAVLALSGTLGLAAPAPADEMWDTTWGHMFWETDLGSTAVLTVAADGTEAQLRLFVEGLAQDVSDGRGSHAGIWIADRQDGGCAVSVVDPVSGKPSAFWGTFRLTFVEAGFPSAWAGVWGQCLETPENPLAGQPRTGG